MDDRFPPFACRVSVTIDEIEEQRAKGWPDFHPEHFCHRCGGRNVTWWIDSTAWNPIMRPEGPEARWRWNEIICIACYVELFDIQFPLTGFRLDIDPDTIGGRAFAAREGATVSNLTAVAAAPTPATGSDLAKFADQRVKAALTDAPVREVPLAAVLSIYADGDEIGWHAEFERLWREQQSYMDMLAASIQATGMHMPILLGSDGRVWDGHHRLAVAQRLGLETVPVEFSEQGGPNV